MAKYITESQGDTLYADSMPVFVYYLDEEDDFQMFDVWEDATSTVRNAALVQSTRLIDSFEYDGSKNDSTQENAFPRNGQVGVPTEVRRATFALALEILTRHYRRVYTDPVQQQYLDNGATDINLRVNNAQEAIKYEKEVPLEVVARPYLKKWLKGRFTTTARKAL